MINKAILQGRVGKDPEVRSTQGGKVANLTLATSESWKDRNGEWQEKTQWHNVVIWNEGSVKYVENNVRKGDMLFVEGMIETRKWQDQSGNDRYTTEIVVKAFNGSVKKVPTGEKRGGDRDDRRDDRDRDRRDDRRGRDNDRGSGGSRGGYSRDLDDEIPF